MLERGVPWHREKGEGVFFSFTYVIVFPTVASRTCDLEAKQILKKKY